ncbi:coproporphyrinogen dehydrogenase HemZ [Alkalicella caledoniensis]|uniref:Coproporphyrinogen dehydrogenase HemZ n=1 Tax=Alkalicella caledoniensis TaxID=2731377 RepID=A0A7G9WAP2_ALKCA|nr:coproporphyrinogen dehydrogenase HemZ [Alkalicella caledoniensis]QNO15754.1 coproporphyrinogen dehydrogenase HemZ [Alkalicella caledoniensis]
MRINCNVNPQYIKYIDELILLVTSREELTFNENWAEMNIEIIDEGLKSVTCYVEHEGKKYVIEEKNDELKLLLKRGVFKGISQALGQQISPWGILTGVRPTKVIQGFIDDGLTKAEIIGQLKDNYLVDQEKIDIMYKIRNEQDIVNKKNENKLHIYIGIPFCPTRCSYCSFTSYTIEKSKSMIEPYVEGLLKEIKLWGDLIKKYNLEIASLYIGGGTPSSLSPSQMESVLKSIKESIDIEGLLEYTFEGGRPDTLTIEKLELIKKYGVTRLSINPQTMSDETLKAIGRTHTKDEFVSIYKTAKEMGFEWINTDLIIGLNHETMADYKGSLEQIVKLNPENITIHALALKRAALQKAKSKLDYLEAKKIMDFTYEIMQKNNYIPYYLYRQKSMAGNQENVGFSKKGYISPYNIISIEETQSVIAMGCGGISKIINEDEIIRYSNPKDPNQYLEKLKGNDQLKEIAKQILT